MSTNALAGKGTVHGDRCPAETGTQPQSFLTLDTYNNSIFPLSLANDPHLARYKLGPAKRHRARERPSRHIHLQRRPKARLGRDSR